MIRAAMAALAVLFALAGPAMAADPLIGGTLTAGGGSVSFLSTSTMPVRVTFAGESVTVSPRIVIAAPGETVHATYTGESVGAVSAHLEAVEAVGISGDLATATLSVNLKPYVAPTDWSGALLGLAGLAALAVILRRVRPWRYRLVRAA